MKDEGGPFGIAIQVEVPNHLKLLWPKAMVVSVKEKAGGKTLSGVSYGDEYKRIAVQVSKPGRMSSKPGSKRHSGMSIEETCLLAMW